MACGTNLVSEPPLGHEPKSRARSRKYPKQRVQVASIYGSFHPRLSCLQEVLYLTSPRRPLPNRPLLSNLSLPNAPFFNQFACNGHPRKAMQDLFKKFPQTVNMEFAPHQSVLLDSSWPLADTIVQCDSWIFWGQKPTCKISACKERKRGRSACCRIPPIATIS